MLLEHFAWEIGKMGSGAAGQSQRVSILVWLGLGTTAVILIALTAGLILRLERQSFITLQRTYVIIISAQDALSDLEDAEVGDRGYLLTGAPSYLESYNISRKAVDEEFDRLRELVKDNPKEHEQVERLHYLVHQELDELQATADTRPRQIPGCACHGACCPGRATHGFHSTRHHRDRKRGAERAGTIFAGMAVETEDQPWRSRWEHRLRGLLSTDWPGLARSQCVGAQTSGRSIAREREPIRDPVRASTLGNL